MIQFDYYFSDGLKPPTSYVFQMLPQSHLLTLHDAVDTSPKRDTHHDQGEEWLLMDHHRSYELHQ